MGGAFPLATVGNSLLLFFSKSEHAHCLPAIMSSMICDFLLHRKIDGTNVNCFHMCQLSLPPPELLARTAPWAQGLTLAEWLKPRILELSYNSEQMRPYAQALGHVGVPFPWDGEKRRKLRAEVDAAFFHIFFPAKDGLSWDVALCEDEEEFKSLAEAFPIAREAVSFILDSFQILKEEEIKKFGGYASRDLILQAWNELALAIRESRTDFLYSSL